NFGAGAFPEGVLGSPNYQEKKYRLGVELSYSGLDKHDILAGMEWQYTVQGDTYAERNYDPSTIPYAPVPLAEYRGSENWLEENLTRQVIGLFAQDQFSLTDKLTMTAGLRFDTYDDVGNAFSPRLAAVYRLKEHQTVKVQYSSAFRPPTFVETSTQNNPVVVGNPDLESEYIRTYELGYIYNNEINKVRATVFYADLHDLIVVDSSSNAYANQGEVHSKGVELEYVRNFGQKFRIDANAAYVKPWNKSAGEELADVASTTANVGLLYRISHDYSLTGQYRYVGERRREDIDPRDNLESYQVVDITFSASNFLSKGLTVRGGVKNLFDADVVYPSPMVSFAGSLRPSYEDDYPRPGREFWLLVDYRI
ncbi:TonB-dependent receptor plug domain-containing protein, partial [Kaarinaea lacus]